MRITEHPIIDFAKRGKVAFSFDNQSIEGYENDTIASALYASGISKFRESLTLRRPRGFFCAIGKCSSCLMEVNGKANTRTCITPVKKGMVVKTQNGLPRMTDHIQGDCLEAPEERTTEVAVIGGGPAGLEAALAAAKIGAKVTLIEENYLLGGQLLKQTHKFFGSREYYAGVRGTMIGEVLVQQVTANKNIDVILNHTVSAIYEDNVLAVCEVHGKRLIELKAQRIIMTTGASEAMLAVENNDLPGVYGAGAVQTLVNIYGVKIGERVLIVGAGNVGLILAYQLLQAGIKVAAVVEAMPNIGGNFVHAAKINRRGVPILTSHTVKQIRGVNKVEGATIVELDKSGKPIDGTEKDMDIDTVALRGRWFATQLPSVSPDQL